MARRFEHLDSEQLSIELDKAHFVRVTYAAIMEQARQDFNDLAKEIHLRNEND